MARLLLFSAALAATSTPSGASIIVVCKKSGAGGFCIPLLGLPLWRLLEKMLTGNILTGNMVAGELQPGKMLAGKMLA